MQQYTYDKRQGLGLRHSVATTIYQTTAFEKRASAMSFQTHAGESGRMVAEACHQQLVLILDSEPYSRCIRPVSLFYLVTNAPRTCTYMYVYVCICTANAYAHYSARR